MSLIWRLVLFFLKDYAKMRVLTEAKRRGALAYLRAVRGLRLAVVGAILGFLVLQLVVFSLVGVVVTGFFLWQQDFQYKIQILFWFFVGLSTVLLAALGFLFSERTWFKASGAQKLVEDVHSAEQKGRHGSPSRAG